MTRVKLTLREAGASSAFEHWVLQTRVFRNLRFPAMFALIEHPTRGLGLFDTGYSRHMMDLTQTYPEKLYRKLLPVELADADEPRAQLERIGKKVEDVRWIFISHFHADHVSALKDFPKAQFIHAEEGWQEVRRLGRLAALSHAIMPGLLPADFANRSRSLSQSDYRELADPLGPFSRGADLFGDGSAIAIPLPGHIAGHLGLLLRSDNAGDVFLIGDAAWTSRSFREVRMPHPMIRWIFEDSEEYRWSLLRLHALSLGRPDVTIIPSHCEQAVGDFMRLHNPA